MKQAVTFQKTKKLLKILKAISVKLGWILHDISLKYSCWNQMGLRPKIDYSY